MLPTAIELPYCLDVFIPTLVHSEKLQVPCTHTLLKSVLLGVCTRIDGIHQRQG